MVAEVKVGQKYRRVGDWAMTVPSEDVCVVNGVNSGRVSYTYESGSSDFSSTDRFYSSEQDYEASGEGLLGFVLIPEEAGHKVKVGQVWKWTANNLHFKVSSVSGGIVNLLHSEGSSGYTLTRCVEYLKEYAVLVEEPEEALETENNQLSPNVYQFPNGVEVKDISAHLTSFGGQAVQYIARATRLDGVVKGLPIQDLYKAIELLKWEAERMEALQK